MPEKHPAPFSHAEVAEAIRRAILGGDLAPGQRLVEADLTESFRASRSSIRSALMDLVHEGLIEHIPNRGARVRIVSIEEALQTSEVRMVVESICVSRAAEKITDDEIDSLRALAVEMKFRAENGDTGGFAELTNRLFHEYVRIADQPIAEEILLRLRDRNSRHRFRLTYRADRARVSLPFWLDIIDSICSRDSRRAVLALERRSASAQEAIKALAEEETVSPWQKS
jgi:DNA-binding GntR family transcriptional regulator